jgi:hypothetical protein
MESAMQTSVQPSSGAKNIVDFSAYRRRVRAARHGVRAAQLQRSGGALDDAAEIDDSDDYRRRITIDAAVFAYVVLLVFVGIWLLDGLTQLPRHLT